MSAIELLVSDVDGTLVTPEKRLTPASVAAAGRLARAQIGFCLVSSRPARGMASLIETLAITLPCSAFNGGEIFEPGGAVIESEFLAPATAIRILDLLEARGVSAWLFADDRWFLTDAKGPEVWRERRTVQFDPSRVTDLRSIARAMAGGIGKIVGVTDEGERLDACEAEAKALFAGVASVGRSQSYYLDFTNPAATKGHAVRELARRAGVSLAATAVIGDMDNDLSMFAVAGLAIAMGQGPAAVRAAAHEVTSSNAEEGFAAAVERFVLPRARAA